MADWNLLKFFANKSTTASADSASSADDKLVVGRKTLRPDARMMQAIGRNHSFESAVADIVDNSLDAGADKILIRFIRNQGELVGLYIVDDGRGMDEQEIDRAMTFGGQRAYSVSDLGRFGVGLKAASLGQAKSLTVVSRAQRKRSVGRRLMADRLTNSFECDVLANDYAESVLGRSWAHVKPTTGTAVLWSEVKRFPKVVHGGTVDSLLDELTRNLCRKLGLVFHRILAARGVQISIDQEDIGLDQTGAPFLVQPIDPFGYPKSGRLDYPRTLTASSDQGRVELKCHIWPGRSNDPNFKLPGGRPTEFQGFFVYRNDRLLHCGGWHGVAHAKDEFQLARVAVDMPVDASRLFEMNPEKTQVEPTDLFRRLAHDARDDTVGFAKFLDDAANTYRESRKRQRERPKVLPPGSGFAPAVKSAISDEYDFIEGREAIEVRWEPIAGDVFFEVDKDRHLIRLNKRYRGALIGDGRGGLNDAPLVKALLYLLAETALRGEVLGPRDKDNIAIWQAVLTAAAEAEDK